jgi:hypothetical protein
LKNIQIFAEMKKKPHFNLKNDSYMKMSVAADQLSISTASPIETLTTLGVLPAEAIFTAEFVQKVYNFLDSLKSANSKPVDHKRFSCALSRNSPHLDSWTKLLRELNNWKLIDLETDADLSNRYSFVQGWQTTINYFSVGPTQRCESTFIQSRSIGELIFQHPSTTPTPLVTSL